MIVLALDTSGATSSAAIVGGPRPSVAGSDRPRAHAQVLPGLVQQALAGAGIGMGDITAVAVARGPGLFTGMRVGLVSAGVFGLALGVPVAGVSTLDAVARRVVDRHRPVGDFAVLLDGRRREVFAACYDRDGAPIEAARTVAAADLRGPGGLPDRIPDAAVFLDASAAGSYGLAGIVVPTGELAAEVGRLALARWGAGEPAEPAAPLYLRQPDTSTANPARSVLGGRP